MPENIPIFLFFDPENEHEHELGKWKINNLSSFPSILHWFFLSCPVTCDSFIQNRTDPFALIWPFWNVTVSPNSPHKSSVHLIFSGWNAFSITSLRAIFWNVKRYISVLLFCSLLVSIQASSKGNWRPGHWLARGLLVLDWPCDWCSWKMGIPECLIDIVEV